MNERNFKAWAIDSNSKEGHGYHGYLGRYYWQMPDSSQAIPIHMEGCRIAMFTTRKIARESLKELKSHKYVAFPKAKVVRISVSIG